MKSTDSLGLSLELSISERSETQDRQNVHVTAGQLIFANHHDCQLNLVSGRG